MAKHFFELIWKHHEMHRGFQIWRTNFFEPIFAVRVGMHTEASLKLEEIRAYVDEYMKTKIN